MTELYPVSADCRKWEELLGLIGFVMRIFAGDYFACDSIQSVIAARVARSVMRVISMKRTPS